METLTHLEVQVKFTDDLSSLWAVNCYGVDWEFVPFKGPFRGRLGRDHDGGREVPWNGLSRITISSTSRRSLQGRPML